MNCYATKLRRIDRRPNLSQFLKITSPLPSEQIHPLYFFWFSFEFFSLKILCSHIFPFSLTAFFTQLPDFSKNSSIGPWMTRRKESISNSFLFSSKNCVRDKPDDASSCTWQSSCSHSPSFFRKHSSLKETIYQHIYYIKKKVNLKGWKCETILLWDCFRILSASPVSCSCCPDPSPLHFAWRNISFILPWLHFLVFRCWNILVQYFRCQWKHKRISYL